MLLGEDELPDEEMPEKESEKEPEEIEENIEEEIDEEEPEEASEAVEEAAEPEETVGQDEPLTEDMAADGFVPGPTFSGNAQFEEEELPPPLPLPPPPEPSKLSLFLRRRGRDICCAGLFVLLCAVMLGGVLRWIEKNVVYGREVRWKFLPKPVQPKIIFLIPIFLMSM